MSTTSVSRRQFARALGVGFGGALLPPTRAVPAGVRAVDPRAAIRISANENPYGPSKRALEALTAAQARAARYPFPWSGALRETIAAHHGLTREHVLLGCGSSEVLRVAAAAFLGPGRSLVAAEPTYEAVLVHAEVEAAHIRRIPLTPDFRHDLGAMAAACDARTGLVYVCNPNNPTGTIVSSGELRAFLDRVPAGTVTLVDEAYQDFVEEPDYPRTDAWLAERPDLVCVRTFSKIHGLAGMRLGYALAAPDRIRAMEPYLSRNNPNVAVLEAARVSLGDTAHLAEQRHINNATRRWLEGELRADGRAVIPSHTSFLMVRVGPVEPVIAAFRRRGVLVGRRFPPLDEWLRVSMGTREEMEVFLEALREIVPA